MMAILATYMDEMHYLSLAPILVVKQSSSSMNFVDSQVIFYSILS